MAFIEKIDLAKVDAVFCPSSFFLCISIVAKKMQINLSHGHFLATLHFLSREVTPTDKYVCRYVRGPVRASVPASGLAVHLCRSSEHLLDSSIVSLGF